VQNSPARRAVTPHHCALSRVPNLHRSRPSRPRISESEEESAANAARTPENLIPSPKKKKLTGAQPVPSKSTTIIAAMSAFAHSNLKVSAPGDAPRDLLRQAPGQRG